MDVVDLLTITVIDYHTEVIPDTQLVGHYLHRIIQHLQYFRRCLVEIPVLLLGNDQQVHHIDWTVIGNENHLLGLEEYLGRQFPTDYLSENR